MPQQHVISQESLRDLADGDQYLAEINELCRVETLRLLKRKLRRALRVLQDKNVCAKTNTVVGKVQTSGSIGEVKTTGCKIERLSELLEVFGS